MLDLRAEIQGLKSAREDRLLFRMLCDALTGRLAVGAMPAGAQDALLNAAEAHGVLGLFAIGHTTFAQRLAAARAKNFRALKFTRRVVAAIEAAGIPVVVLKGAVAASRWADPTVRQQSDVDLLVARRHKHSAGDALIAAGLCSHRLLEAEFGHNDSLVPRERSGLTVEIHHYLNSHYPADVPIDDLLARRITVVTGQGALPSLAPEDEAIYLAMHAANHALARLAWLVDIAALRPNWLQAADRAREWNLSLAVAPAWVASRTLLDLAVPEGAMHRLRLPSMQWAIARGVLRATDATRGETHRFFERAFRVAIVPPLKLPTVLSTLIRARREEQSAYAD